MSPITTLIGTLAGAFFGQQVGSANAEKAHNTALRMVMVKSGMSDDDIMRIIGPG